MGKLLQLLFVFLLIFPVVSLLELIDIWIWASIMDKIILSSLTAFLFGIVVFGIIEGGSE